MALNTFSLLYNVLPLCNHRTVNIHLQGMYTHTHTEWKRKRLGKRKAPIPWFTSPTATTRHPKQPGLGQDVAEICELSPGKNPVMWTMVPASQHLHQQESRVRSQSHTPKPEPLIQEVDILSRSSLPGQTLTPTELFSLVNLNFCAHSAVTPLLPASPWQPLVCKWSHTNVVLWWLA